MKMTIRILLIGFLGFFGCSDGDDRAGTYTGQPSPITPYGRKCVKTITFEWTAVPGATEYCIWVQDLFETDIIKRTYTSEEAGCSADELTCSVTTGPESITQAVWQAQACTENECGPWSVQLDFSIMCMMGQRFIDNGDGTVKDAETGCMWTKSAGVGGQIRQDTAWSHCRTLILAGYDDWDLPTLPQLRSLVSPHHSMPTLPPDSPFVLDEEWQFWTVTEHPDPREWVSEKFYWNVSFNYGDIHYTIFNNYMAQSWPVRMCR